MEFSIFNFFIITLFCYFYLMEVSWTTCRLNEMSAEELYALLNLRIAVFVVEQNCPYLETDGKDQFSTHLFAREADGSVAACLRIVDPGISYDEVSIGRVATSANARGKGLGHELMLRAMRYIEVHFGPVNVRISAQEYLRNYYATYGFAAVSDVYLEDDIPHVEMLYRPSHPKPFKDNLAHSRRMQLASMWEDFEQAKAGMILYLEEWDSEKLVFSKGQSWTALQIVRHIMDSERGTLTYILKKTQNEPNELPYLTIDERKAGQKLIKRLHSEERYAAPTGLENPSIETDLFSLIAQWAELREEYRLFFAGLSSQYYGKFIFRHPFAGPLGMEEVLGFLTGHIRHHMHQLRRIERSLIK